MADARPSATVKPTPADIFHRRSAQTAREYRRYAEMSHIRWRF